MSSYGFQMVFQHDGDENDENLNEVPKINIESVSIEESSESSVEPEYVIKVENHKSETKLSEDETIIETKLEVEVDLKSEMSSSLTDSGFSEQELPSRDSDEISEVHEEVQEDHEKCPETLEEIKTEDNIIKTEDLTDDIGIVTGTSARTFDEEPEEKPEEEPEEIAEDLQESKLIRTLDAEGQSSSMTFLTLLGIGGLFAFALYKLKYQSCFN